MEERETRRDEAQKAGARHLREARAACGRGFRVRSAWWVMLGLTVAIALAFLYFTQRRPNATERGFPNYMQDVER